MTTMGGARAAERLVELGLSPAERAAKQSLFDLTLSGFDELDAGSPEHAFWVPGRLEVFGKHTDYAGGRTLVGAVPRGFAVAIARRTDRRIHVVDAARRQGMMLDSGALEAPAGAGVERALTGWRNYVQTVVGRLRRNFPDLEIGANIVFASDLPRASGMSSSSALMVGVAAALGRIAQLDSRPEWVANIRTALDAASYYACIENGMPFGTLTGDAGVGTHGGSEDHAAIVTGKSGRLSAFAFVPMRHASDVALPDGWRFVLTPSGVAADKTGGAKGPYNNVARGAGALLGLWNESGGHASSLAAALAASPDAAAHLGDLASRSRVDGWPAGALMKRLEHFLREDARIPLAVAAFRSADTAALGAISTESQRDAEILLDNQVPETVALARAARALGAFAASSFGAGFGGSVWALVDREAAVEFASRWHPRAFVAQPAPPLSEL
jgi:galactokinase